LIDRWAPVSAPGNSWQAPLSAKQWQRHPPTHHSIYRHAEKSIQINIDIFITKGFCHFSVLPVFLVSCFGFSAANNHKFPVCACAYYAFIVAIYQRCKGKTELFPLGETYCHRFHLPPFIYPHPLPFSH